MKLFAKKNNISDTLSFIFKVKNIGDVSLLTKNYVIFSPRALLFSLYLIQRLSRKKFFVKRDTSPIILTLKIKERVSLILFYIHKELHSFNLYLILRLSRKKYFVKESNTI